ncbi:endoplasmic reticulum metallopeptidase 1-like [Uloborus diversus]|uniref:endoplasmic reticulum metallopeptidase 1-like n=1 Tax=Uloborus diversus TaxID=327109 RepID=UPI00240A7B8A|nr:endoplasmic reticulum metallopeptidase 1-like [Uloborus diversus]
MDSKVRQRTRPVLAPEIESQNSVFHDEEIGRRRSPALITAKGWILVSLVYFSIFLLVIYCDVVRFPPPLSLESVKKVDDRSRHFSEEIARNFVVELSSIGPKPTGSYENEILAVDYISRQLNYIKSHAKPHNKIDIDLQLTSGCFPLTFRDGMTSCYENVKNIVAKIGPLKSTNKSLLLNCHFDSVPTSPGASDDIVNCAIMLEILISLSQSNEALQHEVIFLFNGAEENILQAAHGFITQHPWAKSVVGFVNLEACGAGGKQMLFQANRLRTWLLQAYSSESPFPQGSVVAQDIFQSGLIPSDTDYRIFDYFGNLSGLDFAYVKNGYVYHTKYDVPEAITEGAIQQAGMNLLNLIHNALKSPDMNVAKKEDQTVQPLVFFDFMGIYMVVYRIKVASVVNIFAVLLCCFDIAIRAKLSGSYVARLSSTAKAIFVMLGSLLTACLSCVVIAFVLDLFGATMSWYQSPYLIFGLYAASSSAVILSILGLFVNKKVSHRVKWFQEDVYFDAARIIWVFILLLLEWQEINSSFICCTWVLFPTIIRGIIGNVFSLTSSRGSQKSHLCIHVLMQLMPLSFLLYCAWSVYSVFVPIMGRIGATVNPDLLIGLFTTILVFLSTSYMFSIVQVMTTARHMISILLSVFGVTFLLVCLTPFGFPYSGDPESPAPMRCYILHTERTFYNQTGAAFKRDSGYWIVPLDYNGPKMLGQFIEELKGREPIDCDAELGCGMPFYMPVISLLRKSYYIPASKPQIHAHHKFEMIEKLVVGTHTYRMKFRAYGPDHMTMILSPRPGVEFSNWTLADGPPLENLDWMGRPTYFIYYSYAEFKEPWTYSIDLSHAISNQKKDSVMDVSFITHYLHGHDSITGDFPNILKQIPPWIHATPWTCTLDMFVF